MAIDSCCYHPGDIVIARQRSFTYTLLYNERNMTPYDGIVYIDKGEVATFIGTFNMSSNAGVTYALFLLYDGRIVRSACAAARLSRPGLSLVPVVEKKERVKAMKKSIALQMLMIAASSAINVRPRTWLS